MNDAVYGSFISGAIVVAPGASAQASCDESTVAVPGGKQLIPSGREQSKCEGEFFRALC